MQFFTKKCQRYGRLNDFNENRNSVPLARTLYISFALPASLACSQCWKHCCVQVFGYPTAMRYPLFVTETMYSEITRRSSMFTYSILLFFAWFASKSLTIVASRRYHCVLFMPVVVAASAGVIFIYFLLYFATDRGWKWIIWINVLLFAAQAAIVIVFPTVVVSQWHTHAHNAIACWNCVFNSKREKERMLMKVKAKRRFSLNLNK